MIEPKTTPQPLRPDNPTLEDVAREANVSTATISRSINEPHKVAQVTRERIQRVIDTLGYTPNFGGKALASKRSNTIGAIIPTMDNAMFASGLQAFQESLDKENQTLLVASHGYDPDIEYRQIRALVARGADGLLLIGAARPQKTLDFLALRKIPHIIAWFYKADSSSLYVGFDNRKAAMSMTNHVLNQGHQNLAMIAGISAGNDRVQDRVAGVKMAIDNFSQPSNLIAVIESAYTMVDAAAAFDQLMARQSPPTAIICGNDVLAAGAITQARHSGIRVPEDVSITGFDDITLATAVVPTLTTVHVPHRRMGRLAADLLMSCLNGSQTPESVEIEADLVLRDSLGPPPVV